MRHMTSGPVVALCLQRENAVGRLLEVLGPSDPRAARRQSQFFLRGSFGEDSIQNAFYGTFTKTWSILFRIFMKKRLLISALPVLLVSTPKFNVSGNKYM